MIVNYGSDSYVFKHALVRDAAYSSLLKSRRQQLHERIGRKLEAQFPETAATQPELLARHFTEAGLREEALSYWQKAGTKAAERSANAEAITQFTTALELLRNLPDSPERTARELKLQMSLGPVLIAAKGNASSEVEQTYLRARELCQGEAESNQLFPVLFGLRSVYLVRGEIMRAHELSEQLLNVAQTENDTDHLIEAHLALGNTLFFQGMLVASRIQFEQALNLYDPSQHKSHAFVYGFDPGVFCLGRIVWVLWLLGYPDQAEEQAIKLIATARRVAHPLSLVVALNHAGLARQSRGEIKAAHELYVETLRLSTEQGFNLLGQSMVYAGSTLARLEQPEDGIAKMREGLKMCQIAGAVLFRSFLLCCLADEYVNTDPKEGLVVVAEAQDVIEQTGERFYESGLLRTKGELLLRAGLNGGDTLKEAEDCFLKAIEIARRQDAKYWELRATMSLSRLWHGLGKADEARRVLSNIYGWFTEGFSTSDLREAHATLETLS
jgi:predicted ATPase